MVTEILTYWQVWRQLSAYHNLPPLSGLGTSNDWNKRRCNLFPEATEWHLALTTKKRHLIHIFHGFIEIIPPPPQTKFESESKPCAAVPIRSVSPTGEQNVNVKSKAKSQNVEKNKTSAKGIREIASELLKVKRTENKPSASKRTKREARCGEASVTKNPKSVHSGARADFSGLPPPFCSCTGVSIKCYKCGGGWQSSCCTTSLSEYPLPLNPSKPGKRVAGRKMTDGAYNKLLCTLATEGRDLSSPVDLKNHWAKLGSNKFITLK